jgi:hypothetical protein
MAQGDQRDGDGHAGPEDESGDGANNAAIDSLRNEADDGSDKADAGGDEHGVHAIAPDARLTGLLSGDTSVARSALDELRARHLGAVLRYARLCADSEPAARQLADDTLASAAREMARGLDPQGPLRHHLLLLTGRVAVSWTTDHRAGHLAPGLTAHLGETLPVAGPRLLTAFRSLPAHVQGLVWYGLVDQEPADRTALLLGCAREDVTSGSEHAFQAMRQSVLTTLLARSASPRCQDFRPLIEEAAHPETPRHRADLQDHMAHCGHCAGAYQELAALRDTPRTALAEGLLAWGGTAYVMGGAAEHRARGGKAAAAADGRWPKHRLALVSAALGMATVPLLYVLASGGSEPAAAEQAPARPPAVTSLATAGVSQSAPATSPSGTAKSPGPKPSPTPSRPPSATTAKPAPSPTKSAPKKPRPKYEPHPPNGAYAQVVNAATGLCLDIRDGVMESGTDVIAVPCASSRTQIWRFDSGLGVLQSYADPGYCLDSRGSVYKGVGIWDCGAVHGGNGQNLRFTIDTRGTVHPVIAPECAVTPYGGGVFLAPDQGREDQRWRAGAP